MTSTPVPDDTQSPSDSPPGLPETVTATLPADENCRDCSEDHHSWPVSRRRLLAGSVAAGATIALSDTLSMRTASAAVGSTTDTLVVLWLNGAADGLNIVVPVTDPNYYKARPTIAIPKSAALQLDSKFGLHPAAASLLPFWKNGNLAIVHAAGLTSPVRSHFAARQRMEEANPGGAVRTGWLDRTVGLQALPSDAPLAVTSFDRLPPDSVFGPQPNVTMESLADFQLTGPDADQDRWTVALEELHARATAPVGKTAREALAGMRAAKEIAQQPYAPSAKYPNSALGVKFQNAAQLIKSPQQVSVVTIDHGSWDMHTDIGTVDFGWLRDMLTDLSNCLAAFMTDLGSLSSKVTLVALSEFGRRTEENASGGADHGWGNFMFVMGGGVKGGGTVRGNWPGLGPESLFQGDLAATTDYQSVLADVLVNRCGASLSGAKRVFPTWDGSTVGLLKPRA